MLAPVTTDSIYGDCLAQAKHVWFLSLLRDIGNLYKDVTWVTFVSNPYVLVYLWCNWNVKNAEKNFQSISGCMERVCDIQDYYIVTFVHVYKSHANKHHYQTIVSDLAKILAILH